MKLLFKVQLPSDHINSFDWLARVIWTIADNWHEWYGPDPNSDGFGGYFEKNPHHLELVSRSYGNMLAYGGDAHARVVTIVDSDQVAVPGDDIYPLDKAVDFLVQPLRVLVENEISDGYFYMMYLRLIDPVLAELFDMGRPPIVFDQGGGNMEIVALVEHRVARAAEHCIRPRLVVLADSDSKYPGHSPADTNTLLITCSRAGVPVHVTKKRSQENYIPDAVILEAATMFLDLQPSASFITGLSEIQRDHYPMKKGLSATLSDGEAALYQNILPSVDPEHRMKIPRISEFFRETSSSSITIDHLHERACYDEFSEIVRFLREEL